MNKEGDVEPYSIALVKLDLGLPADQARWVSCRTWQNDKREYWDGIRWVESADEAAVHFGLRNGLRHMLGG